MRFELIDCVLERQDNRLTAIKTVSRAEEYLADHFPGFPVLPGVLMLESLVQAARLLVNGDEPLVVQEVRNVRYGSMVRPGQTLRVEVNLRKRRGNGFDFQGVGTINSEVAVQGRFSLEPVKWPVTLNRRINNGNDQG